MKNKLSLLVLLAAVIITGCAEYDNVIDEKTIVSNSRKITFTASMPDDDAQTRVSLERETGTKKIIVKWKAGDIIQFFFKQGATTLVTGTSVTLAGENIIEAGKKASFSVNIPVGISESEDYTVYALHGAEASVNSGKINVNVSPSDFKPLSELTNVPIAGKVDITGGASIGNISFAHLGVLHCLGIKNTSSSDLSSTPTLYFTTATDVWYHTPDGEGNIPYYDLIGEGVQLLTGSLPAPSSVNILAGNTLQLAQWVMPNTKSAPEIWLKTQPTSGVASTNSKPARTAALTKGKAYHLYAVWNGTTLAFTDDTFTPPLAIDELALAGGNLMHACNGANFIGMVYSKGDGKVYYNAAKTNGTWAGETDLGTGTQARVAIDNNNYPHVVYTTADNKIAYLKYDGTAWTVATYIVTNDGGACSKPDIAIDGSGFAHITYTDSRGQNGAYTDQPDIMYAVNSSGTFVKTVIYNGYVENYGGANWGNEYYEKGSFIALDASGNYYIIAHHQISQRWLGGSDRSFNVAIKTSAAGGSSSSSGSDIYDIYDLQFNGANVIALYKDNNINQTATITVSGTTASFTSPQTITTAVTPHSLSATASNMAISALAGTALFTKYNTLENTYTDVVKTATKVVAVNVGGTFYSVYTDNADSKIKIKKMVTE